MKTFHLTVAAFLLTMCALGSPAFGQLIIGHRGASHDAPENTLASNKLAFEQGADGVEGDYWLTAGGQILDLHDKDTKRVAGKKLDITTAPFKKLRRFKGVIPGSVRSIQECASRKKH